MNEIKLTDHIRNSLRAARTNNKTKGSDICKALKKHPSFISHIENGVVKTVEFEDLKNILGFILKIDGEQLDSQIDGLIGNKNAQLNNVEKSNEDPDYEKLSEDRQEEIIEQLQDIVEMISEDISSIYPYDYEDYEDCEEDPAFETNEKFLTTFISIMSVDEIEIINKFYALMSLPLQKLNPVQFQELINKASDLLEYEYVFESGKF